MKQVLIVLCSVISIQYGSFPHSQEEEIELIPSMDCSKKRHRVENPLTIERHVLPITVQHTPLKSESLPNASSDSSLIQLAQDTRTSFDVLPIEAQDPLLPVDPDEITPDGTPVYHIRHGMMKGVINAIKRSGYRYVDFRFKKFQQNGENK